MAMITHNIELDVVPGGVLPVIHVNQYDSSVCLNFHLYAREGKLQAFSSLTAAKIRGTKADGNGISVPVTSYSYSARTVTVNLTQQMTACAGRNVYELVIYYTSGAGEELCTANFILYVERAALDKDTLISGSEIRELVNVVDRTDELLAAAATVDTGVETIQALTQRAETASSSAEGSAASAAAAAEEAASALTEIGRKKTEAVDAITIARDNVAEEAADALTEIRRKKTEAVDAITTASENAAEEAADALAEIRRKKNESVDAVNAAGESAKEEMASELTKFKNATQSATETLENESEEYLTQIGTQYRKVMNKGDQILQLTTSAEEIASDALSRANNARNGVAALENRMSEFETALENVTIDPDDLGLWQDEDTFYVYPTYRGVVSENGIPLASSGGGGGGGGDVISAVLTVENTSGWLSKTISSGSSCPVAFNWSSIEDDLPTGDGTMRITVNEVVRASIQIRQGNVSVDLAPYLATGTNKVKVRISDTYDQGRTTTFNITSIMLSLTSSFDSSTVYSSAFSFPYTPVGAVEKTIYFVLDGSTIGTEVTSVSNRQMSFTIPAQSHGAHSLRVYFEAVINQETVRSNELYFEFIYTVPLDDTVIITSSFDDTTQPQYSNVPIPFLVYDPANLTAEVEIYADGTRVAARTVDRNEQSYIYKANSPGTVNIDFKSGGVTKRVTLTITESEIDVEAETRDLALYLTVAPERSNEDEHPEIWEDEDNHISASLTGFNFSSDGWQTDKDGIKCLRVSGDARVTIPCWIFAKDFRTTGKTIEMEFSTRNVLDYDAVILSCMSGDRGLSLTAQKALLKSEQSEISTQYKEDEHVRISFVAEKRTENRLLFIYINGIASGVVQYPADDNFEQITPVGISIGSNDCIIDLYNIRVYDNDLTRHQIVENWIADTQDGSLMLERYTRNNVFDAYGNVVIANLPSDLCYLVRKAPVLPQYKGDKKTIDVQFVNPLLPSKSFTATGVKSDVQGTSSQYYPRKNYKDKYENGFVTASGTIAKYAMNADAIPVKTFTVKADMASSEKANNVLIAKLTDSIIKAINRGKTPAQIANPKVRQTIDGFPVAQFWDDGESTTFLGLGNFNNDKGTEEVFGFVEGDESWETLNNTGLWALWKTADYSTDAWKSDFEPRYPDTDPMYDDTSQLAEFASFVVSTDRTAATGDALAEPVTYDGVTYTNDTADYRLAKFKAEIGKYADIDSSLIYYLITELFLMVDSRSKNAFPSFIGEAVEE